MDPEKYQQRKLQRQKRILDSAAELIPRLGYDKASMEDIAFGAEVSKGALYLEWESKEALFDALLRREMGEMLGELRGRLAAGPAEAGLAALYTQSVLVLESRPLLKALYTLDSRVLGDFVRRQDPQRYTRRLLLSTEMLQRMQQAGQLRADLDPEVMAYVFSLLALGFMTIGGIVPAAQTPALEETAAAMGARVEGGFIRAGSGGTLSRAGLLTMLDLMLQQNGVKNDPQFD